MVERTARLGWDGLLGKGSTEFEVVKTIYHDEQKVIPISTLIQGEYNQQDVYASIPAIVGKEGVQSIIEINLTPDEVEQFNQSCTILKDYNKKSFEYSKLILK